MKQLTIFCSRDLEGRVVGALDAARVEGYLRIGGGTAHRFGDPGSVPRSVGWEATLFVVPAADDPRVRIVIDRLEEYAGACEVAPCLRIVVAPVEMLV